MTPEIRKALSFEFKKIENYEKQFKDYRKNDTGLFVDDSLKVIKALLLSPYEKAEKISADNNIDPQKMKKIYKLIQRTDSVQNHFLKSHNRDYFQVAKHYFNKRFYTIVFFIGGNCPSRCIFCPNVYLDENGNRKLRVYNKKEDELLQKNNFEKIFKDITKIKNKGTDVLVKISGGLEPLTDTKRIDWITSFANENDIHVKIFTNGLLLNTKERRSKVLKTQDIRISLTTTDEEQYTNICFDQKKHKGKFKALKLLKKYISQLIKERDEGGINTKVGFNSLIMPTNFDQVTRLIDLACELKLDYVDFKPDYFSSYDRETEEKLKIALTNGMEYSKTLPENSPYINFTNSIDRKNFYWNDWKGYCDCILQSNYKMFITPHGECSPVHYGAFPDKTSDLLKYTIGKITNSNSLLDVLVFPEQEPILELKKLNPFELMLTLEMKREEEDKEFGIPVSCSPYHTKYKDSLYDLVIPKN